MIKLWEIYFLNFYYQYNNIAKMNIFFKVFSFLGSLHLQEKG